MTLFTAPDEVKKIVKVEYVFLDLLRPLVLRTVTHDTGTPASRDGPPRTVSRRT